ncbi:MULTISPECIES: hypothetical protein [unclassified Rhizobium]
MQYLKNSDAAPPSEGRWYPSKIIIIVMAILLVFPSLLWAFRDVTVWSWDQASYGNITLRNFQAAGSGFQAWYGSMSAPSVTAPLLVWTAQLFVPFTYVTGRVEVALLLSNVAFGALTLMYVGLLCWRLTNSLGATITALLACAGAPLFISMAQTFLAEGPQIFTIAFLINAVSQAGRRRLIELLPAVILAASLAMLAKVSSFMVIGPLAVYLFLAAFLARTQAKRAVPLAWVAVEFLLAVIVTAATCVWYDLNWQYVITHARTFSISDSALLYGTKNSLLVKLGYWGTNLADALTPYHVIAILISLLVILALLLAMVSLIKQLQSTRNLAIDKNGFLFALCLAGTIVVLLFAYSLQINEDPRFLSPLLPIVAVLTGWSAHWLGSRATKYSAGIVLANYIAVQLISAGADSSLGSALYLSPPRHDTKFIERIENAVHQTCKPETYQMTLIVGVSLPEMNENSLNFEQRKSARARGFLCDYRSFTLYNTDAAKSIAEVDDMHANTILTLPISDLPADASNPYFFANATAVPFAKWLADAPGFMRTSGERDDIVVYRRIVTQ